MDEETLKKFAAQLRKPHGDFALNVAQKMNEGNMYMNRFTIEKLNLQPKDKILEIGMGNGFFIQDIMKVSDSIQYTGCDFSESMVEEAGKMNRQFVERGRVKFFLTPAHILPFDDQTFDKVFTVNTLYFWENPDLELSEVRRVLKPSGRFVLTIRPKTVMEHYPFVKHGFITYSQDDLEKVIARNHFKTEEVIHKLEPDLEFNGQKVRAETLIICATRD